MDGTMTINPAGMSRSQERRYRASKAGTKNKASEPRERGEVAQTAAAQYEAAHGISHWWRGECNCWQCVEQQTNNAMQTLIDRNGTPKRKQFKGLRKPKPFLLLAVRVERNPYRRTVVGYIAYDDQQNGRTVNPDIAEMTEPEAERSTIHGGAKRLRRGESYEGLRTETQAMRGTCPGCGGLSDGNLCLACAAEARGVVAARKAAEV
jgi:hypothetical protein